MNLIDRVKQVETKKEVSEEEIKKFFESLDYSKAVIATDRTYIKVKFNDGIIKIKDYPFPTENESIRIFYNMGISDVICSYSKNGAEYFTVFEFLVDKNKMETQWYK